MSVVVKVSDIWFPGLKFNKGKLLNVWLIGVHIVLPPSDIVFWNPIKLISGFTLFDSSWVTGAISDVVNAIPKAVWDLAKATLDSWADDFYKKHCTYEEYVKERKK